MIARLVEFRKDRQFAAQRPETMTQDMSDMIISYLTEYHNIRNVRFDRFASSADWHANHIGTQQDTISAPQVEVLDEEYQTYPVSIRLIDSKPSIIPYTAV